MNGNKKASASEKRKLRAKAKKLAERAEREIRLARQAAGIPIGSPKKEADAEQIVVEYVSAPREYEDLVNGALNGDAETANGHDSSARTGFASAGFVSSSDPEATPGGDTPVLGSLTGLGGAGLGATPQSSSEWDMPGLGSTAGLGATPGPSETPSAGGLGFETAPEAVKKEEDPYKDFERIFSTFASAEEVTGQGQPSSTQQTADNDEPATKQAELKEEESGSDEEGGNNEGEEGKSKKKRKMEARLKIADLKQACPRPEVVEVWDVTAQDPKLLVYLKAYRNSVPVPRHWSQKRKYLQGKRGIEKPMFKLPEYIEATGIGEMRQAYHEKEENKKLKSKQREKMQPKMGKLDIDYQVLHDAFFKHQTKPNLTVMGDLYYEGKEYEARVKSAKPGILSPELREGLGMGDNTPPPWLINMQRYGPPPSYPDLKIAGLNAPIPPGARFGYQPGGWGKPPVDENGEPLYGDVFGQYVEESDDEQVDKVTHWGDLESEEEEESSEEEEEEEDRAEVDTESLADGLSSVVSGYSSLPSGLETPEALDLRKGKAGGDRPLYQVLEQQAATIQQGQLMGTDHTYVIPPADSGVRRAANVKKLEALKRDSGTDVEVAIDPEELEGLDEAQVKALYEQRLSEERARHSREDFSDMVANKAAQQKRKAAERKESGKNKKQKDSFQF